MNDLTLAAIQYLGEGHHLLALHGKRPNPRYHAVGDDGVGWSWEDSIHGLPASEEEEAALDEMFTHPSTTGVAILIPPHVLVADVDTEEAATLYMAKAGETPETRISQTPNGLHIWFLAPGFEQSLWIGGRTLLFKGFGGYVAAPPSRHFTDLSCNEEDGVYTWLREPPYDWLPDGLRAALDNEAAWQRMEGRATTDPVVPRTQVVNRGDRHIGFEQVWPIEGLLKSVRDAPEGNRNNMLAWAAMQAAEEGVPYDIAMPQFTEAALAAGLTPKETHTTIRASYRRKGAR